MLERASTAKRFSSTLSMRRSDNGWDNGYELRRCNWIITAVRHFPRRSCRDSIPISAPVSVGQRGAGPVDPQFQYTFTVYDLHWYGCAGDRLGSRSVAHIRGS